MTDALVQRDLAHVWHPCTQMHDHQRFPPIPIARADGPFLYTRDGRRIIDAISSWWCKSLGHAHPAIRAAVARQMQHYEHIIAAGTVSEPLVQLSEQLTARAPGLDHVFYADNGSTGVEVALKLALQYQAQSGATERRFFAALQNGYHGETILTLAAGDCDLYGAAYASLMPTVHKLGPLPYVSGRDSAGWDCLDDADWALVEAQLNDHAGRLAAVLVEPLVQGAGGMRVYSAGFLRRLRQWTRQTGVLLIADEIMTGMGRTGRFLACEHAGVLPDLVVLSKGLTAGWLPMAAVLAGKELYAAFYDDYCSGRAFLHSNTYCGNALATAAALAAITVYDDDGIFARVAADGPELRRRMAAVASQCGCLQDIRGLGFVCAADLVDPQTGRPFPAEQRLGFAVYQEALRRGAWLRALGDTIYFLPPLNTPDSVLDDLAEIAAAAIAHVVAGRPTPGRA